MNYSLSCSPDKVSIVVPRRFSPFLFAFIPIWVTGWITFTLRGNRNGKTDSLIGLIGFGIVTVLFIYVWLWNLGGKEKLEFTVSGLTHKRILLGFSRSRVFRMKLIDNPHFENSRYRGKSRTPSGIGFSYKGKKFKMGDNLTQRGAKEIVAAVLLHLPEVRQYWGSFAEGFPESEEELTLNLK
jgi:hypothetical protein